MGLLSTIFYGSLVSIVLLCVWVAWILYQRAKYFKKHKIPYLGSGLSKTFRTLTGSLQLIQLEREYYTEAKATKAPIVAFSEFTGGSCLLVLDPEIIKRITVKDSDHFVNQRPMKTSSSKFMNKMLFLMRDQRWKTHRHKMTPAFTTGKIKRMCQIFSTSSENMEKYLKQQINYPSNKSVDIDFSPIMFKYLMNVIAGCAFGVDSKGWETKPEELSTFEKYGKKLEFRLDPKILLKFVVILLAPKIADLLKLEILNDEAQTYFDGVVRQMLKERRQSGKRQEDFLQLMMDIQQGTLKAEEEEGEQEVSKKNGAQEKIGFDDDYVIANALMFFLAGYDSSFTVLIFTLYSLALDQEVQEKLYKEVKSVKEKYGGKFPYDALFEMPYLEMVVTETTRLFPAPSRMERECTTDYFVEEIGYKIKKGTIIAIPSHGIHMDPEYYENPTKYMPERFSQENKAKRHPYTYLAFGQGARSCIGNRFALTNIRAVIAQLVSSFKLAPCSKTQIPMKFDASVSAKPLGGMWLNVTVREE